MLKEIEETVRRVATRLLQQEEVREANVSQSGSDAVALTEPTADASSGQSSDQKLAASVEQGVAAAANVSQSGNDAAAPIEPTAESSIGRSTSQKRAASAGQRAAAADCMPGQSEIARQSKKPRISEGFARDTNVPEAQDDISLSLQATPVVEAIRLLDTLPAGERVDELRALLSQWRGGATVRGKKRTYIRKVAAQFGIPLPGNTHTVSQQMLRAISEAFTARVSALRFWRPGTGSSASAAGAAGGFPPGTTAALESLHSAAARGSGARGSASSGAGEPAVGIPGTAPDGASTGKRKAKGLAGEDSCAEEPIGATSGAAGSSTAASSGTSPQGSVRRRICDAAAHETGGEGSTAGESRSPGAGGAQALARGEGGSRALHGSQSSRRAALWKAYRTH